MRRGRRGYGGGGIAGWLLPASVLHAALGSLALILSPWAEPPKALVTHPHPVAHVAPAREVLELTLVVDDARALGERSPASASSTGTPLAASNAAAARDNAGREPPTVPRTTAAIVGISEAAIRAAIPSIETLAAPQLGGDGSLPAAPASSATARAPSLEPEVASISLDQLGIGRNPFMTEPWVGPTASAPLSAAEQANQRLQASLHQQWFDSDRQRGLGPEGTLVDAARRLLVADEVLSETSAVLNIRVDGGGRVTDVRVLEASSQGKAWQMIAARLAKQLGPMALDGPGSNQGWGVKLRLASALKLPSGLAPGLRTDILGLVLPGSAGSGAASLSLTPTSPLRMPEPIDRVGRQVDKVMPVELGLLKLTADVADIGGSAQRVVQVAVLSVDEADRLDDVGP
jgi:hypothetical protein